MTPFIAVTWPAYCLEFAGGKFFLHVDAVADILSTGQGRHFIGDDMGNKVAIGNIKGQRHPHVQRGVKHPQGVRQYR